MSYLDTVIRASGGHAAPVEDYFASKPLLCQKELKAAVKEMGSDCKKEYVQISELIPTQEYVETDNFKDASEYTKQITVYRDSEGMKLVDGHHRCASRVIDGQKEIEAMVYEGPVVGFSEGEAAIAATAGSKPAPKKYQIKGSDKNPKGSASGGKSIKFSKSVEASLKEKAAKHNEKHGKTASKKTSVKTLKAVYRRGAGAYSTSHRPDQNRNSWAMARVNAFLHLLRTGSPKNSKYTTDNDLLPAAHPKSSKKNASSLTAAMVFVDSTIKDATTVEILTRDDYASEEHAIFSLAEYSDLSYDAIPAIRAAWTRAISAGDEPFERAALLASALYDSPDADLLPVKKED